jgi:hypothetical protein
MAQPFDPSTGAPRPVAARRWYCAEHRAGRDSEMEPWSTRIVLGPSGFVDLEAQELDRAADAREAGRREVAHTQRREQRAAELPAAEIEAAAEALAWVGDNLRMPA